MPSDRTRLLRTVWVVWLRFEYRALAVLLPVVCLELALASAILAQVPVAIGLAGGLPALLAPGAWRFAAQIGYAKGLV